MDQPFTLLSPDMIMDALERDHGIRSDGSCTSYFSYINRVYGLKDEDGQRWIAKIYRPGRWTRARIEAELVFTQSCYEAEIPVVPPMATGNGSLLGYMDEITAHWALFPHRAGRHFDSDQLPDLTRMGELLGRVHAVGRSLANSGHSLDRLHCSPTTTTDFIQELWDQGVVHPDLETEFFDLCDQLLIAIEPRFQSLEFLPIHGDCHRGNILDRGSEGLILVDFDDMMIGPAIQDLWMLLPGTVDDSRAQLDALARGYDRFSPFPDHQVQLIEPLRAMRMVYFIAWCATQQREAHFLRSFPHWGTKAFWLQEIEDLKTQIERIV